MSSSIIDFVNCHTEKENGDNKYINDKFLDVKEINSEDMYVTKNLNLKGVVPANSVLGTDANFNIVNSQITVPTPTYWCVNNGTIPTTIPAGQTTNILFGNGNFLEATPNMSYTNGVLSILNDGIYLFNFSGLISVSAPTTTGNFTIQIVNTTLTERIFRVGQSFGIDVNNSKLINGSFIISSRAVFPNWTVRCINQYPTQTVNITNMNTSIYKISN